MGSKHYNVLSVDWDYFFPDSAGFDWGHREAEFFINIVWMFRVNHIDILTKQKVLDYYIPSNYEDFWDKAINLNNVPPMLAISESHSDMWSLLFALANIQDPVQGMPPAKMTVYNFDAHHDLGYGEGDEGTVDCQNWAWRAFENQLLNQYNIIFPEWKRKAEEIVADQVPFDYYAYDINIHYDMPMNLPDFDMVFICRSGAWTPPWYDQAWAKFIGWWAKHSSTWERKKIFHDAMSIRSPDLKEAVEACAHLDQMVKDIAN